MKISSKNSNSLKASLINTIFIKDRIKTKISRLTFLLINIINQINSFFCIAIGQFVYNLGENNLIFGYITLLFPIWIGVHSSIYRLNDIGKNRLFVLLLFIPIINLGLLLFLLFARAKSSE